MARATLKKDRAMGKERVFVIGLDAADPDLLDLWIKSGELPFFEQLMREGTYCRLKCIPPTFSPVEWTSILTGTNPGKHSIFGFEKLVKGSRQIKVLNRTDRKSVTFYEILAEAGKQVGLINMVMTYPAAAINGFMITGMETPDLSSPRISYPKGLIEELRSVGCNYQISPGIAGLIMDGRAKEAVVALDSVIDERYKATKYLMEKYDCDDATFVICSDHGMGFNYEARYYLKELFTRLGWYCPADTSQAYASLRNLLARVVKSTYWLIFKRFPIHYKRKIAGLFPNLRSRVELIVSNVDWDRTRIYSNDDFFSIMINKIDREGKVSFSSEEAVFNFRDRIIEKLRALEELGSGKPLVKKVHTREALYSGDYVDDAPDLVIEWEEVRLRAGIRCGEITIRPEEINKSELHKILSGEHRPYGILLIKGEMIQKDRRMADGSILDIAPTVLYLAGQPIPKAMDGKVLLEAFCESFRAENPVKYIDAVQGTRSEEEFSFPAKESLEIQERLRKLGYIE
jgi:predicted AlkP superfamily phosphohydrolase/phosphomutase